MKIHTIYNAWISSRQDFPVRFCSASKSTRDSSLETLQRPASKQKANPEKPDAQCKSRASHPTPGRIDTVMKYLVYPVGASCAGWRFIARGLTNLHRSEFPEERTREGPAFTGPSTRSKDYFKALAMASLRCETEHLFRSDRRRRTRTCSGWSCTTPQLVGG